MALRRTSARGRDDASTQSIGLIVASGILAMALMVPLTLMPRPSDEGLRYEALRDDSEEVLRQMTSSPGRSASGDTAWENDPANALHYALLEERAHRLDPAKVQALREAPYETLRERLGSGTDFRVSVQPLVPSVDDPTWRPLALERTAYLGHYAPPKLPISLATNLEVTSTFLNMSTTVTNLADEPGIFSLEMGLGDPLQNLVLLEQERQTRLLEPGESQTVWVRYEAMTAWDPTITGARVSVTDLFGNPAETSSGTLIGSVWYAVGALPTSTLGTYNHLLEASEPSFEGVSRVTFLLDHFGPLGADIVGAKGRFVLLGPTGDEWVNETVDLPAGPGAVYTYTCANCTVDGLYTAYLYDTLLQHRQADQVVYSALPLFQSMVFDERSAREADALAHLLRGFDAQGYDALTTPSGDIYSDHARGDSRLTSNLARYSTVVVGSNIKQNTLTPHASKTALHDWVLAGGTLVVLGSQDRPQEWMRSTWKISLQRDASAPQAFDPHHPALVAPDHLATERYATWGRLWEAEDPTAFDHVVGAPGSAMRDAFALSRPGAFGAGTLALVAYTPGNLSAQHDEGEARRLLHNVLVHAHTRLYLEHGPDVPLDRPVASATRLLVGTDPLFAEGVPVRVVVRSFEG